MGESGQNEISGLVERLIESSLDNQAVNHRGGMTCRTREAWNRP